MREIGRRLGLPHGPRWHTDRRKKLLQEHPEVRKLVGPNPWSALFITLLVFAQFGAAVALRHQPWWLILLLAYFIGAISAHAIGVMIHELAHDLVFESGAANRAMAIFTNLPLVFPAAIDFRDKHLQHHAHLGEPNGPDTQAPQAWDLAFANSRFRTMIWHAFSPLLPRSNPPGAPNPHPNWLKANIAIEFVVMALFTWAFGFKALLFLAAAGWFAFSYHPVAARRYGEHLTEGEGQPTTSYYGPYNRVSFDVGYHVEHHDLPSVPWNRLPLMNQLAPELYRPLVSLKSWNLLLFQLFTARGEGPRRYYLERPIDLTPHHSDDGHHRHAA